MLYLKHFRTGVSNLQKLFPILEQRLNIICLDYAETQPVTTYNDLIIIFFTQAGPFQENVKKGNSTSGYAHDLWSI